MHIAIISGSMRPGSQSRKVANYMDALLRNQGQTSTIIDLYELQLPAYDDQDIENEAVQWLCDQLSKADGFVFISPEWNGMMSYGLMNMLLYVSSKEMADKPVLLAGVSNTRGGFYPVAQMQMIGQKNRHYVILPEHLVLSNIEEFMNDLSQEPSAYIEKRTAYALRVLVAYADALGHLRAANVTDYQTYRNGM